jgi:Fe-S-cluster containining protein
MDDADAEMFAEDIERLKQLPEEAQRELCSYIEALLNGDGRKDPSCIWLNRDTMQCRYHEHRPSICRELEMGSEDCRGWRKEYQVGNSAE